MTRVFSEGFEMQDRVGMTYSTSSFITTSAPRSGLCSLGFGRGGSLTIPVSDLTEAYIRVGFKCYSMTDTVSGNFYIAWRKGTTVLGRVYIDFTTNSFLEAQVSTTTQDTGSIAIVVGPYFFSIELHIKIDDATGVIETKVDGIADATFSGDTKPGADSNFDNIYMLASAGGLGGGDIGCQVDDIAINDTAGAVDNSWTGDGHIIVIKPTIDTATLELTPSAAVDHYTLVDDIPADGDTTYVEGSVDDEEDIYDMAACGLGDVVITRIWTEARARDTASTGKSIALITKASGGAEVSGGDVPLLNTYTKKILGAEQLVNPVDSAAWEVADIDALQGGVRTRP